MEDLECELQLHASLCHAELRLPCALPAALHAIKAVAKDGQPNLCIVSGVPGCGRRSILAHAAAGCAEESGLVLYRQCAASAASDALPAVLRSLCAQVGAMPRPPVLTFSFSFLLLHV